MKRRFVAAAAVLALAAPATAIASPKLDPPGPNLAAPLQALRSAAQARGVTGATDIDARRELGLDHLNLAEALDRYFTVAVGQPLSPSEHRAAMASIETLDAGYREGLGQLMTAMATARELRDAAYEGVTVADIRATRSTALQSMSAPESVSPADTAAALAVINRIDMNKMLHASALLVQTTKIAQEGFARSHGPQAAVTLPFGSVVIGTSRDDVYRDDVQLLIDSGGNDTYLNNAGGVLNRQVFDSSGGCVLGGGTTGLARPNLGCTPTTSKLCTFNSLNHATGREDLPVVGVPNHADPSGAGGGNGNDGSCGSNDRRRALVTHTSHILADPDSRGVALLLDMAGNDTYTVPWGHDDPLFGLVDFCYPGEQNRVNTNRDLFQGGTLAGVSVLWDRGGDNVYRGRLNAQGSGHVGGVAVQVADKPGNDVYWADRLSQGNGVAGGVGVLVNTKDGDQTYLLDAPSVYRNEFRPNGRDCAQEGRAGQGEGGFLGVGVLWNQHHGSAVYRAVVQATQAAYPFDHVTEGGIPVLTGGSDSQGSGESFPITATPGGIVAGVGLLYDQTDGDASICAPLDTTHEKTVYSAGMVRGSRPATGTSLATIGAVDRGCGKFNLGIELDTQNSLEAAFVHILGGAVGQRVVL